MEELKIELGDTLDTVVRRLLQANEEGKSVFCVFNGVKLYSDTVTMDSAYREVMGCTREEYIQKTKKYLEEYDKKSMAKEAREKEYLEKVAASRTDEKKVITLEEVIDGLKFIAEHQSMSQEELIDGLLDLDCNFTLEDIKQQFPEEIQLFEGMKNGNIACGASVIANTIDSEYGRSYCEERFLSLDDDISIYHFIRVVTGDETYTKEYVDELNNTSEKHR